MTSYIIIGLLLLNAGLLIYKLFLKKEEDKKMENFSPEVVRGPVIGKYRIIKIVLPPTTSKQMDALLAKSGHKSYTEFTLQALKHYAYKISK